MLELKTTISYFMVVIYAVAPLLSLVMKITNPPSL